MSAMGLAQPVLCLGTWDWHRQCCVRGHGAGTACTAQTQLEAAQGPSCSEMGRALCPEDVTGLPCPISITPSPVLRALPRTDSVPPARRVNLGREEIESGGVKALEEAVGGHKGKKRCPRRGVSGEGLL